MKRVELFIGLACALIAAGSLGLGGVKAARNPFHERLTDFERQMAAVTYVPEEYKADSDANYNLIVMAIVRKSALWKELVPAPVARAKPVKKPDLKKMLNGVRASSRLEMTVAGGGVLIDVKTLEDRNGSWLGVGDKVNGLTIEEITKEAVLFSLTIKDKEYTYSLSRR